MRFYTGLGAYGVVNPHTLQDQRELAALVYWWKWGPTQADMDLAFSVRQQRMSVYGKGWGYVDACPGCGSAPSDWNYRTPDYQIAMQNFMRNIGMSSTGTATTLAADPWTPADEEAVHQEVLRLARNQPVKSKSFFQKVVKVVRSVPAAAVSYNPFTASFTLAAKTGLFGSKAKGAEQKLYSVMEHRPVETVAVQAAAVGAGFAIAALPAGAVASAVSSVGGQAAAVGTAAATSLASKKVQEAVGLTSKPKTATVSPTTAVAAAQQPPQQFFEAGMFGMLLVGGAVIGTGIALFKPEWIKKGRR